MQRFFVSQWTWRRLFQGVPSQTRPTQRRLTEQPSTDLLIYFMYTHSPWPSDLSLTLSFLSLSLHTSLGKSYNISPCTLGCFKKQKRNLAKHWSMNKQNTGGRGRLLTKLMVQLWRRDRPLRYVHNCHLPFHSCPVHFALRSIQDQFHTVFKPSPERPVSSALTAWLERQTTHGHEPIVRRSSTLVMHRSRAHKIFGCYAFPGMGNIGCQRVNRPS